MKSGRSDLAHAGSADLADEIHVAGIAVVAKLARLDIQTPTGARSALELPARDEHVRVAPTIQTASAFV